MGPSRKLLILAAVMACLKPLEAGRELHQQLGGGVQCPPPGLDSVPNFDIRKYISGGGWYAQKAMPVAYSQPPFFCARAQYSLIDANDTSKGLNVFNYGNDGAVNGRVNTARLVALPTPGTGATVASKLNVGYGPFAPLFRSGLGKLLFGQYYVMYINEDYTLAIISGGLPEVPSNGSCSTGLPLLTRLQTNNVGLWLFSKKPVNPDGAAFLEDKAKKLGYDTSVLLPVTQEGCLYKV